VASGTISGVSPSLSSAGNGEITVQSSGDNNNNNNNVDSASPSNKSNEVATVASGTGSASSPSSAAHFSSSDPVLVPSDNSWFPGAVGAIRREVGNQHQHSLGESNTVNSAKNKLIAG